MTLINDRLIEARDGLLTSRPVTDVDACATALDVIFAGHPHLAARGLRTWRSLFAPDGPATGCSAPPPSRLGSRAARSTGT